MRVLYTFMIGLFLCQIGTAQTTLTGKISYSETGEEIASATIKLYQNGNLVTGAFSDFDGNYNIKIRPGSYDVEFASIEFRTDTVRGVNIYPDVSTKLNHSFKDKGFTLTTAVVYGDPVIDVRKTRTGTILDSKAIMANPSKNILGLARQAPGVASADDGDPINLNGSREDGTAIFIDGIRVFGSNSLIPASEVAFMEIITGGIAPKYGDLTGGIISVTTKGPSNKYSGSLELESSQFLDAYGYNLISGNLSGPLLRKKNKTKDPILSFRFSGQYLSRKDDDPAATPIYTLSEQSRINLEENPISSLGSSRLPTAESFNDEDILVLDYQPNEQSQRLDLTGKLNARFNDNVDIILSGSMSHLNDRFTPGENNQTGANWRLLNSQNNPLRSDTRYRGNLKINQRFGNQKENNSPTNGKKFIDNASLSLILGYEKRLLVEEDSRHENRFFDYGHVGNFDLQWVPSFEVSGDLGELIHVDYSRILQGYTPGNTNPGLTAYNQGVDFSNLNDFSALNGEFIGAVETAWNFHTNINQVYNQYQKQDNDLFNLHLNTSFDLYPSGSSDDGRHEFTLGIIYEQRINRGYNLDPNSLWQIARQQANRHILGVDTTQIAFYNEENQVSIYETQYNAPADLYFYQRIRELTGNELGEYVNVDGLDPDQLSLDLFSAQELNDQFNLIDLNYWGFDFLGNKLSNKVTFDHFFTAEDENGVRTFPVASSRPIYTAAYIQDRFSFGDIIFNIGMRTDFYDANTKVLKDPYSLYEVMNANDFFTSKGEDLPAGVESDYKVYIDGPGSETVKAYRDNEDWFFADGSPANGGNQIFAGNVVTPKLYDDRVNDIKSRDFDPSNSFEDYKTQINWMPRLSFSFPISDEANFFAHYDILVQRPSAAGINVDRATALDYYYFNENQPIANPNLKPQKTIDYEVGFQQKLSNNSSLKVSSYYKEMRDMIQRRSYLYLASPVNNYTSYSNQDFGTVKGFNAQYNLRRTNNFQFSATYSLAFADGTGSDADSQRGLTGRGNLRTLFPLNFDQRHNVNLSADYRTKVQGKYTGPYVFGQPILKGLGINLQTNAVSGRPFTAKAQPNRLDGAGTIGQINGARLPWNFTMNLRIDKTVRLYEAKDENKSLYANIYLRIQNLLDRKNIIQVYPATGSPDDDGYLASPFGEADIKNAVNSGRDVDAFLDAYQWRVLNPNFFSLPRRMYAGILFDF